MTKMKDIQERLRWITDRVCLIVNSNAEFNMKNTNLINARFTYINTVDDYKLLLSFRTRLENGEYDYPKITIDPHTIDIKILDNSIVILANISKYFNEKKEELNVLGKELNDLNKHISEVVGANIKLSENKYFRYCSLSIGYSRDENCIAIKITERINNKPARYFIKFIEKMENLK